MGWVVRNARLRGKMVSLAFASTVCSFLSAQGAQSDPSQIAALTPQNSLLATGRSTTDQIIWPTLGWTAAAPETEGIDSSVLAQALEQIRARRIPVHSLLIERHGRIVLDTYFYPFADNRAHNVYSVTKSVTSMLVGIAMAEHRLNDLNAPVLSLLPLPTDDPRKSHITLANLLSMTSGLDCRPAGGMSLLQQMLRSRHLAAFMMNRPEEVEPGTVFDYCGGNSEVVSAVLTQSTGASAFDYARDRLFAPLGITQVSWPTDADHVSHGWGDLELQPRDMAKLGYLWLHNGRWGDRQIVPADYLAEALSRHINVQPGIDYGYGMWLYPCHTPVDFEANGSGGQRITVIPSLDIVEVTTGNGLNANVVAELVAPAIRSDAALPANSVSDMRLASLSYEAALRAGEPGTMGVLASALAPSPKPASPSEALVARAVPAAATFHDVVYPRPKPDIETAATAESIPVPRPRPSADSSSPAALSGVPVPRPKPSATSIPLVALSEVPRPRPRPRLPRSAIFAAAHVPASRPKRQPVHQLEAAVVGFAVTPNAATGFRPLN